jgi:N-acetyl-gamma-glutamyl-phosphate reductase
MTIAVVGAAGYTGGMLLRLLARHPEVDHDNIHAVSQSQSGRRLDSVHADLVGMKQSFGPDLPNDSDVIFLCMDHGKARAWMQTHDVGDAVVIDLSSDHRLDPDWVYGLPEVHRDRLRTTKRIANPGCFATCIELGLLRLGEHGQLKESVVVNATTGSTGAGQAPSDTTHFSWRANNLSVYKAFTHQHLDEIEQILGMRPVFIPMRGAFPRGILASCVVQSKAKAETVRAHYRERFEGHPFVHIVDDLPDVKRVVGTNNAVIGMADHDGHVLVVSVIDNLVKGASGQAIQNMNLACGFEETAGLDLVGIGQ